MKGQQTVLHKLMFGNLGTAIWELLLSSNLGCQIDVHGNWEGFEVGSRQGKHPACSPQAACRPCNQHADDSILMQTIQSSCRPSNHHADHTTTMQSPCKLCNHHAITMQSPCNHHALTMQPPCNHHADHAITMQSPCNHHAITMQLPCNHHAITMQVLLNPLMLQRTLSSTERVIHKATGLPAYPKAVS